MEIQKLGKITKPGLKRLGRGHGSGRGKTSGRGTKGQKARSKVLRSFEGGALPLVKRLPFLRGRGRNTRVSAKPYAVNIESLNVLSSKSTVDVDSLIKKGLVAEEARKIGVKIIGSGDLKVSLTVNLPVSKGAKAKIEAAGGTVTAI